MRLEVLVHRAGARVAYIRQRVASIGSFTVEESRGTLTFAQTNAIAAYLSELTAGEDDALRHARERAAAGGMPPVSADTGAFLRVAARWSGAQAAVEIGSGAGYSGIWLARGLSPKATLTTIEADPEHQRLAKASYEEAGVSNRIRAILGRALDVLPRLSDGGYDLAFIDARKDEYPKYLEHALRLVRPGGIILADNVLWSGRVADPKATDPDTEALRLYSRHVAEDDRLESTILTIGDGLAVSLVRRDDGGAG
jgi:predicted O-methyltransferase YrrM